MDEGKDTENALLPLSSIALKGRLMEPSCSDAIIVNYLAILIASSYTNMSLSTLVLPSSFTGLIM